MVNVKENAENIFLIDQMHNASFNGMSFTDEKCILSVMVARNIYSQ